MEFATEMKSAKDAFLDFARTFLNEIAKMIIQQMILNALKSASQGSGGWGALIGAGVAVAGAAAGGSGGETGMTTNTYTGANTGAGTWGGGYSAALGGIFQNGFKELAYFAKGGIATRPTLGLVGEGGMNEAVIPLPDGKNVPVKMRGNNSPSVTNNINVSVDSSKGGTREQNNKLGQQIAKAVDEQIRKNIVNERRWGGVLGPQGARIY
jgi:hypothetical protein